MSKKVMREHMAERFGKVNNFSINPPLPKSLNIELNNTCNHKCIFCDFHGDYALNHLKPSVMRPDFVIKILDQAIKKGIGSKELGFYLAGEVFLYKEFPEILAYAKKLGFKYTFITSNGSLADPDLLKLVVDTGLDSIRFSVNAIDRQTYKEIHKKDDFDKVMANLSFLHEYKEKNNINIATSVSCVITKSNYEIRNDIKYFFSQYVDDVLLIPVLSDYLKCEGILKEKYLFDPIELPIDRNFICPLLFDTMYINSDGIVFPCCHAYFNYCGFADLNEDFDLEKAWNSDVYVRYRKIFTEGLSDEGTVCKNCISRKKGLAAFDVEYNSNL